jgi:translocation and assembly module TamA
MGIINAKLTKEFHLALKKIEHGKIFTHDEYEDAKKLLLQALSNYGYLKGRFTLTKVELNRDANTANIILEISTGPRFRFGKVSFQSTRFDDYLLCRYIPFKANADYNLAQMQQFHKNLESSGFFSKIRIDLIPDYVNDIVNMNVRLENRPLSKYTGSIGYGTDTGVRVGLGWSRVLESQQGHKISANTKLSQIRRLANISYYIPGEQAADDRYIFSFNVLQEKLPGGRDSLKNELSALKQQKRNNTEVTYSLNYFGERFRLIASEDINFRKFLLPNVRFTWINEVRDLKISIHTKAASRYLASDGSIFSTEIDTKKIFEINDDNKIILHNQIAGLATNNFDNLPPSLRFYAGGDYSVRGFDYKSLGPTKYDNNNKLVLVGGKYLFTASIEYERKIYKEFGAAIFIDSGNAFSDLRSKFDLAVGAGIGFRYQTALGTIKADIARPINVETRKKIKIHLSFGAEF